MKRRYSIKVTWIAFILILVSVSLLSVNQVKAEAAMAVSIGTIDYDRLTMQVFCNNNTIVYYSIDNNNWSEVEGAYNNAAKAYIMDISWVSNTSDVTLYFKGDIVKTVKSITLPKQNTVINVKYDKFEEEILFEDAEEANSFEWRKSTDYNWTTVSMDETSSSFEKFMKKISLLQTTGAKIIIRIPQAMGTGLNDVGVRPSKEVTLTLAARAAAPSIKVNSSRLTLNTSAAMEYYDPYSDLWIECSTQMSLEEIAPRVLYENGGVTTTLRIRKAATSAAIYSKTATITIPGQAAPPRIGDSSAEVTYYFMNSKLMLQFNRASEAELYEYVIVRPGAEFNIATASWKTVKSSALMTISGTSAPEGSMVYVRRKGKDADTTKGTGLVLPSAINSFSVDF